MAWLADIQKLRPGDMATLFDVDLTPIGGTVQRIAPGPKDAAGGSITWQGNPYLIIPIMAEGFSKSAKGAFPRPNLTIATTPFIRALIKTYDGLRQAKVTRWQVYRKYLDDQPTADPDQHSPPEIFFIANRAAQGNKQVQFVLRSPADIQGKMIPRRICTATSCPWPYRKPNGAGGFDYSEVYGCDYVGTNYFDRNNNPTTAENDACAKNEVACTLRFGANNPLPFGGFPGIGRVRG